MASKLIVINTQVIRNAESLQHVDLGAIPVSNMGEIGNAGFVTDGNSATSVIVSLVRGALTFYVFGVYLLTASLYKFEYPGLWVDKNDRLALDIAGGTQGDIIQVSFRGKEDTQA